MDSSYAVTCEVNHLFANEMHQNSLFLQMDIKTHFFYKNGPSVSQHHSRANLIVFPGRTLNFLSKIVRELKVTTSHEIYYFEND